jgi:hypothetical protein
LDFVDVHDLEISTHDAAEGTQQFDYFLLELNQTNRTTTAGSQTDFDNFDRLLIHAFWPGKLRPFLWLTRSQKNLETFLDIIHEVLGGI